MTQIRTRPGGCRGRRSGRGSGSPRRWSGTRSATASTTTPTSSSPTPLHGAGHGGRDRARRLLAARRLPGFVKVLDEHTLAVPDRPGNKIADSFRNLAENDGVGLLFLIPGVSEVLRVNGRAYATDEPDVLARMQTEAKRPVLAIVVEVAEAYFHCGRALLRSRLWDPASQALADELPPVGEVAAAQMGLDIDPALLQQGLEASYRRLY
ncbi:pyridoxamine 5'-phosphate oxidase family protein [Streptomyces sp. M19]